jgi:carbamoyltransferase
MTAILGISAFYHDSAAALVVDGEIVAAAQEERFSRRKHDDRFPQHAIDYCLAEARLRPEELDYVGFYDKPLRKFERLLETYVAFAPRGYRSFRQAMPVWLKEKLHLPREMRKGLHERYRGRFVFTDHHESHAASAFFPSPFDEAAILTIDGVGEWSTACLGAGRGNRIELTHELRFPHSLGMLYSAFTYYTGFRVNSGEYKLMGLAPYGEPVYRDVILKKLVNLKDDGSLWMDMRYFNYCQGLTMTSRRFHDLFGRLPRKPEGPPEQLDMDLAASIQAVAEEAMLRMARQARRVTGLESLVLAGGVALNCVGNGRILREGPFADLWIQPAAGDAGGALGTALFIWHQLLDKPRRRTDFQSVRLTAGTPRASGSPTNDINGTDGLEIRPTSRDAMRGAFLGPAFSDDAIAASLRRAEARFTTCASDDELCDTVASLIEDEQVVGWFQGRMEFGPRALGARSILGDARSPRMQSVMNLKIKFRESFRPFAPIVLREHVHEWFDMREEQDSPYMLLVAPVAEPVRVAPRLDRGTASAATDLIDDPASGAAEAVARGLDKLKVIRSRIPAVTHVDYSARIQTVDEERHPLLHGLLTRFYERTGCPVMINTSFNVRGEPIVCTPEEAFRAFQMTEIDVLVLGRHVVLKNEQRSVTTEEERKEHLAQFALD